MMLKILAAVSCMILTAAGERPPISAIEQTLFASPQPEARPEYAERGSLNEDGPEFEAKEEKEILAEENATKQLRSSVVELSEEAEESEGVGTSLRLLMSSAAEFFNSAKMAEEVAGLESLGLVKEVADHGASLRDRFQAFVLQKSLKIALGNDDPDPPAKPTTYANGPDKPDSSKQRALPTHIGDNNNPRQMQYLSGDNDQPKTDDDLDQGFNVHDVKQFYQDNELTQFYDDDDDVLNIAFMLDDDEFIQLDDTDTELVGYTVKDGEVILDIDEKQEDEVGDILFEEAEEDKAKEKETCTEKDVESDAKALEPWIAKDDDLKKADVIESMRAFCQIAAIVNEVKGDELPPAEELKDVAEVKKEDTDDSPAQQESGKTTSHLEALQEALEKRIPASKFPTGSMAGLRRIYSRVLMQEERIRHTFGIVQSELKKDWLTVRAAENILKRMFKKAAQAIKMIVKTAAKVVKKSFRAIWVFFRSKLRKRDLECQEKNQEEDARRAAKAGLKGKNALLEAEGKGGKEGGKAEALAEKMTNAQDKDIDLMCSRSQEALEKAEEAGEKIKEDDVKKTLKDYTQKTRDAVQDRKYSKQELKKVMSDLETNEKKVVEAEKQLCTKGHAKAAKGFKEAFQKAKGVAEDEKTKTKWPNLGTRGVGANLGPISGGYEEILDFHNLEIAQFKYGSALSSEGLKLRDLVPTGTSAVGISVGSYAGFGWKGYKRDWGLETAIAASMSSSASITLLGAFLSGGVSIVVDADASQKRWKAIKGGAKRVAFGVSVGVSLSPLPVGVDPWSARRYTPMHAECFDTIGDFIKYLWWPGCKYCETKQEKKMVRNMRAGVKIASFPIIAETVHTVLALIYHKKRDLRTGAMRCSSMSTRDSNHKIPEEDLKKMMMDRVLHTLYQSMLQLKDMSDQVEDLIEALDLAEDINKRLYFSPEYWKLEKEVGTEMRACAPGPLEDAGSLYTTPTYPDDISEVKKLCEALGTPDCDEKEKDALIRARVGGTVSLSKGYLTVSISEKLGKVKGAAGGLEDFFKKARECCDGKECKLVRAKKRRKAGETCLTGLQAAEELHDWSFGSTPAVWKGICSEVVEPLATDKKICEVSFDNLIQRVLLAAGAGEVAVASPTNAFGLCSKDSDCPWKNQVCEESGGYLKLKRCSCKQGYCFFAGAKDRSMECAKAGSIKHSTVEIVKTKMRHYILREQAALGELARDLKNAFLHHQKKPV